MAAWRLARALEKLRAQVGAKAPNRSKSADGSIGDQAHRARKSEHNPNAAGVVRAIDITHDPAGGFDSYRFAEMLRVKADPRIYYIISNGKIANPGQPWRKYTGSNPHDHHVHISVAASPDLYDDARDWDIGDVHHVVPDPAIVTTPPTKPIVENPFLLKGARGDAVARLQRLLKIEDDGVFGPKTDAAVKAFQRAHKLVVDGKVGVYTWRALLS